MELINTEGWSGAQILTLLRTRQPPYIVRFGGDVLYDFEVCDWRRALMAYGGVQIDILRQHGQHRAAEALDAAVDAALDSNHLDFDSVSVWDKVGFYDN